MTQKFFACLSTLIIYFNAAMAQEWSKADSIWLQNVLEGKEELKLNENTRKAIEDGSLIKSLFMKKNNKLPLELINDFDIIGKPDLMRKMDPYAVPPAVYALYIQKMIEKDLSIYSTYSFKLTDKEKAQIKMPMTTLSSRIVPMNTDPLHNYGVGNLKDAAGFALGLISKKKQKQNQKNPIPFSEYKREQMNQEINRLRRSIKMDVEQEE